MQPFDKEYVCDIAKQILNIDSPTGYTKRAIDFMDEEAKKLGYTTGRNQKGNLLIYVDGKDSEHTLGLSAHLDTLGLMVRSIKDNGKLAITKVGGPCLPTLDGEYCIYRNHSFLFTKCSRISRCFYIRKKRRYDGSSYRRSCTLKSRC